MPTFRYQALNEHQQQVAGNLHAEHVEEAIAQLEARGLTVQAIGYASGEPSVPLRKGPMTNERVARAVMEKTILGSQLERVREGAKTITPALRAYSQELLAGRRRHELESLIRGLESSDPRDAEKMFARLPDYWIPLLSAATTSHDPARVLQEFLRETQRADELRRQWWLTISYPLVIAIIAGAVLTLLSVLVIPIFRRIFHEFNMLLPWYTDAMINLASVLATIAPLLFIAFLVAIGWLSFVLVRWPFRPSDLESRLPAFVLGRATAIARFSQFLADLLEAGLTVPDTLRVTGYLTSKKRLKKAAWRFADRLETGAGASRLNAPRGTTAIFHTLHSDMPLQSRIRVLREISQSYAEKAGRRLSWTRGIIEPLAILAIGLVVASVVIALFLPLIDLVRALAM